MSAEAQMFLIFIRIFSNSHPNPTLNTCLKCFSCSKLSSEKSHDQILCSSCSFWKIAQNLGLDFLIKLFL